MKRNILSLLLFVLTTIFIVSCSDSSDDSGGSSAPDNKDPLVGTYDITFFWTDARIAVLTNDCAKSKELGYESKDGPSCRDNENVTLTGEGTISKDESGNYQIITKVQMAGGIFDNPNSNPTLTTMMGELNDNKYNYTVYSLIPAAEISSSGINVNGTVKGTTGRNLTKETDSPNDTYKFTLQSDGTLLNEMTNNMVTPAEVRVIMKKRSDQPIPLDPNKAYDPAPDGFEYISELLIIPVRPNIEIGRPVRPGIEIEIPERPGIIP